MSEFREDFLTGNQVIISEKRAERPKDFNIEKHDKLGIKERRGCPFCHGNEHMTPKELFSCGSSFNIRVVENKYPIIEHEGNIYGKHYVIIEGQEHRKKLFEFEVAEINEIVKAYLGCAKLMYANEKIKYVQIFKNYKREGGASLEHPHSQAIGMSIIPKDIVNELSNSKKFFDVEGKCYFCKLIEDESEDGSRIVSESENFIALCPYASAYPYEVHIIPKKHLSSILTLSEDDTKNISSAIKDVLGRLFNVLGDIPLNMYFHFIKDANEYYHFHIEICPRLNYYAGLELSTGIISNTVMPEKAAKRLRDFGI